MIEPEDIAPEDTGDIFQPTQSRPEWSDGPVGDVEGSVDHGLVVFARRLLGKKKLS